MDTELKLVDLMRLHTVSEVLDYQYMELYIYSYENFLGLLKSGKFKDIGNIYDFPEIFSPYPTIDQVRGSLTNYKRYNRLAYSSKLDAMLLYKSTAYSINVDLVIDTSKVKKLSKILKKIYAEDSKSNLFNIDDLDHDKSHYIEVALAPDNKNTGNVEVLKKKMIEEHLVFDSNSTLTEVMTDIKTFFDNDTPKVYKQLELNYRRGIVLYGDPGNGKSAMLREIIRTVDHSVKKIVINSNVEDYYMPRVLRSLVNTLNGHKSLIIIEDIDSLITERNRSEFLNILDGVDVISGIYFIATTNYPERIDPAFMNRAGRFDKSFKIDNPSDRKSVV